MGQMKALRLCSPLPVDSAVVPEIARTRGILTGFPAAGLRWRGMRQSYVDERSR